MNYSRIYTELWLAVQSSIRSVVNDYHASEELTQETFLALYNQDLNKFRHLLQVRRWLFITGRHKALNYLKVASRTVSGMDEYLCQQPCGGDLAFRLEHKESIGELHEAISSLPNEHKTVCTMYYVDRESIGLISKALNIPIGTVKSRLYFIRMKLKASLKCEGIIIN